MSKMNNNLSQITAISSKNQSLVNRTCQWLIKHNIANDQRDLISNNLECEEYESKEWRQINKKCEITFDKYLEMCSELPKREVAQIEKLYY